MAEIIVENSVNTDYFNGNSLATVNDPCVSDRFGADYVVNDTYNNAKESFSELEPYNGYPNRLEHGEEMCDRVYDHDYNAETTLYHVEPDEVTLVEGEVFKPIVYPGTGKEADKCVLTLDLPSLIWVVEPEYQEFIYIIDSNRVKALKATPAGEPAIAKVFNCADSKYAELKVNVVTSPSGEFIAEI